MLSPQYFFDLSVNDHPEKYAKQVILLFLDMENPLYLKALPSIYSISCKYTTSHSALDLSYNHALANDILSN
jgi:hypothetical protein